MVLVWFCLEGLGYIGRHLGFSSSSKNPPEGSHIYFGLRMFQGRDQRPGVWEALLSVGPTICSRVESFALVISHFSIQKVSEPVCPISF